MMADDAVSRPLLASPLHNAASVSVSVATTFRDAVYLCTGVSVAIVVTSIIILPPPCRVVTTCGLPSHCVMDVTYHNWYTYIDNRHQRHWFLPCLFYLNNGLMRHNTNHSHAWCCHGISTRATGYLSRQTLNDSRTGASFSLLSVMFFYSPTDSWSFLAVSCVRW